MLKRLTSLAARSAGFSSFVRLLERADRNSPPGLLRVLTYHRVDRPDSRPDLYPGLISAAPEAFDQQMAYLAANYHLLSMGALLNAIQTGAALPPRATLVTFDDAYLDFAEHAWPILKRHRLPAALFVPTGFPDQPGRAFWWDRLHQSLRSTARRDALATPLGRLPLATEAQRKRAFSRLRTLVKSLPHDQAMTMVDHLCGQLSDSSPQPAVLGWEALRQLAGEGVTLGAHTRTHPLLNRVPLAEARAEAAGSLRDLERETGPALPVFAYPGGQSSDEVVRVLDRDGFALAFKTGWGINDLRRDDLLRLRRINVGGRTTLPVLRARLLSYWVYAGGSRPLPRPANTNLHVLHGETI